MSQENEAIEAELVQDAPEGEQRSLAIANELLPELLPLLPLTERPFFPAQVLPLMLSAEAWLSTLEKVVRDRERPPVIGLILSRAEAPEKSNPDDFYTVGTAVRILQLARDGDRVQFVAQGLRRFRIVRALNAEPPYMARVEYLDDSDYVNDDELRAYSLAVINTLKELVPLNPLYSEELKHYLSRFNTHEPSPLADFAAALTTAAPEQQQEVLDTVPVLERMKKVVVLIKKELEVARLQNSIRQQVEEKVSEQQRKFFLREQLKVIQQELGIAKDDRTADLDRFRQRLEQCQPSAEALRRCEEEMDKLSVLESGSPEYGVTRNYLDAITALPWGQYSTDKLDLRQARRILDRDHDGLDDVKQRILEFIAVGALRGEVNGSILLLVGPPGVGKTSIGRSVAEVLGRHFYRFSVGGMRDEAEIKGHRRTYIGAMPGKFIQAVRECTTANPVIMLDEIDKISASYHGDPASALLEVLDPEQNGSFLDHYLDLRFDLSRVLFIATANQLDSIPAPLLDRMETIRLSGYITAEKVAIARHHLWPRQLERGGLERKQLSITDAALHKLIDGYAREAGVRNLEKQLSRIVRKSAVEFAEGRTDSIRVGVRHLERYLGQPTFQREQAMCGVGVITGLAWTAMGGATLSIEANRIHQDSPGFKLTGRLGEVMQESAAIAHSYISANAIEFSADPGFFRKGLIHLHVPEGATPKDGPSAGITMAAALLSLALGKAPRNDMAMTGELTLGGVVLPVGGIREKVVAARRNRISCVVLPEANRSDFDELPAYLRRDLEVHFVSRFAQVARLLFVARKNGDEG